MNVRIPLWEIVTGVATGAAMFTAGKCLKNSKEWAYLCGSAHGAYDMLYGMYTSKSLMCGLYEDMNALGYLVASSYTVTINIQEDVYTY